MNTDTKAVSRWDLIAVGENTDAMLEVHDGDYVRFADHERVAGELTSERDGLSELATRQAAGIRAATAAFNKINAELSASRAEVEGLKKDAERYRWLKEGHGDDGLRVYNIHNQFSYLFDSADEAIDAAMKEQAE